jgi:hypothetical protein
MGEKQYTSPWEFWRDLTNGHFRSLKELLETMLILPGMEWGEYDPFQSQRHLAIAHVLCSIPPGDYQKLVDLDDSFLWFIPHFLAYGKVEPFPITIDEGEDSLKAPYAKVLYLSPRLERAAWDITVATVAHELAHIILEHDLFPYAEGYDAQEEAASLRICEWGFEREAKKHKALRKRQASYLT